ncbi:MAG: hypothetical protein KGR26_09225 [Cyanobacteria bacterium REEB65]|nr:hypothetical protein [Cyanobacteria bacterium REEB65]
MPRPIGLLRMQHEAEPLPAGAEWKLSHLYGPQVLATRFGDQLPDPSLLLLADLLDTLPDTRIAIGVHSDQHDRLSALVQTWGLGDRCVLQEIPVLGSLWARDPAIVRQGRDCLELLVPSWFRREDPVVQHQAATELLQRAAQPFGLPVRTSNLLFEGGDVLAAGEGLAFVGETTLVRNLAFLGIRSEQTCVDLGAQIGAEVHPLPTCTFHLDLCLCFPEPKLALLADPAMGIAVASGLLARGGLPPAAQTELSAMVETTRQRDALKLLACRRYLEQLDFQVVALPFLHGVGDDTSHTDRQRTAIATFHNGLFFREADRKVAVLGSSGYEGLDHVAERIYEQLGWEVRWVRAAAVSTMLLGGVRCATLEFSLG